MSCLDTETSDMKKQKSRTKRIRSNQFASLEAAGETDTGVHILHPKLVRAESSSGTGHIRLPPPVCMLIKTTIWLQELGQVKYEQHQWRRTGTQKPVSAVLNNLFAAGQQDKCKLRLLITRKQVG